MELETIPRAKAFPPAVRAIEKADLTVIGPGDLFTSVVCNLVVDGIVEALKKTRGKVVYVMNLMARYGQSYRFSASDHLAVLKKYLGDGVIDAVLLNNNQRFPEGVLERYKEEHAFVVKDDLRRLKRPEVVRADLLGKIVFRKVRGDALRRSIIRHDSVKLAKGLMSLLK